MGSPIRRALTGSPAAPSGSDELRVNPSLLLRGGKRPRRPGPTLLTEGEVQLLGRAQAVGVVGPEGRARLVELQGAEHVAPEEALLARDLGGTTLGHLGTPV